MGRWSGSCRGSIQRRPGHIMLELARDMRQSERSPRVAAMHNCADHGITQMAGELIGGCAASR